MWRGEATPPTCQLTTTVVLSTDVYTTLSLRGLSTATGGLISTVNCYRTQQKLRKDVFTSMCQEFCRGGGGSCMPGGHVWQWRHAWWRACMAGEMATAADSMHPTGMPSCATWYHWRFTDILFLARAEQEPMRTCSKRPQFTEEKILSEGFFFKILAFQIYVWWLNNKFLHLLIQMKKSPVIASVHKTCRSYVFCPNLRKAYHGAFFSRHCLMDWLSSEGRLSQATTIRSHSRLTIASQEPQKKIRNWSRWCEIW